MKKVFILLIALFMISGLAYSATAPTNFTMTRPTATYYPGVAIKVSFTMQVAVAGYDSILIVENSDSTSTVAVIDTTGITWGVGATYTGYVTALTPNTSYAWQVRVLKTATHTTSNGDTLVTLPITHMADNANTTNSVMGERVLRWDSYLPFSIKNTTITLSGSSDTDSSVVYTPWKYNSLRVKVTGADDSCKGTILIYSGYTGSDESRFRVTVQDSINVTAPGVYGSGTLTVQPDYGMYLKFRADTDNGNATIFTTWINRNKD